MMNTQAPVNRIPAVYICHGGGPLPLLGAQVGKSDENQLIAEIVQFEWLYLLLSNLQNDVASQLKLLAASLCCKPKAIVVISAHWLTTKSFSVTCSENHSLLFDYGGFPAESYQLKVQYQAVFSAKILLFSFSSTNSQGGKYHFLKTKYPAPGSPSIAQKVCNLLRSVGLSCTMDKVRGWDHGVFVPLLLMFPDADIPVVELSLHESLDPNLHVQLGQALSSLRDENVLLVGCCFLIFNHFYN